MRFPKSLSLGFCLASLLVLIISSYVAVAVPVLQIKMTLDKQTYNVGDAVNILANITLDGNSTPNLAAIELDSPYGNPCLIRTVKTGNVSGMYFRVQFSDLYTCNSHGTPEVLFELGDSVYVNVTIKNIDYVSRYVIVGLYVQSSDNRPLYAYYATADNVSPQSTIQHLVTFPISSNASYGQARVFASLFTDYPVNGGYAYCPEQTANFSIGSSTPAMPKQPDYNNITFSLPRKNAKLGNYTIHAATNFNVYQTSTDTKQFTVVLLGDINKDSVINMRDIAICIALFLTTPSSSNWNPLADVNNDGVVNMRDIALLVSTFANTAIP